MATPRSNLGSPHGSAIGSPALSSQDLVDEIEDVFETLQLNVGPEVRDRIGGLCEASRELALDLHAVFTRTLATVQNERKQNAELNSEIVKKNVTIQKQLSESYEDARLLKKDADELRAKLAHANEIIRQHQVELAKFGRVVESHSLREKCNRAVQTTMPYRSNSGDKVNYKNLSTQLSHYLQEDDTNVGVFARRKEDKLLESFNNLLIDKESQIQLLTDELNEMKNRHGDKEVSNRRAQQALRSRDAEMLLRELEKESALY